MNHKAKRVGWFPPAAPLIPTAALPHWRETKILDRLNAGYPLRYAGGKVYFGCPADDTRKAQPRRVKLETFLGLLARGVICQDQHESTRYVRTELNARTIDASAKLTMLRKGVDNRLPHTDAKAEAA